MGSVNIFLGGTGKHIAEDIQDSRAFYDLETSIGAPIAFDLDATTRAGVDLRGFVHASGGTLSDVDEIAGQWAAHDPGTRIAPAENATDPGPQLSPEHAVLIPIGEGIDATAAPTDGLYALRGHGLSVFSSLFDSRRAMAGAGVGTRLKRLIEHRIGQERDADGQVRINLVTSTAGGTGAGTLVPLALWLRSQFSNISINLVAVTPTAFQSVLRNNPNAEELKAKGYSGTYAMFRELSFFQGVDPQAGFSERHLPVIEGNLVYAPGCKLFDRAFWFGGREGNDPRDAFEEAGALVRVLNSDNSVMEINGKTGSSPLQSVGAITAIEYPRLRLQRKLVSRVLVSAYKRLRDRRPVAVGGADTADTTALLDYVRNETGRSLGEWFSEQRSGALALGRGANAIPLNRSAVDGLVRRIKDQAQLRDYSSVRRGSKIGPPNYDGDTEPWKAYVNEVTANLRTHAASNQNLLAETIPAMRGDEEKAFGDWLRDQVFKKWLSGEDNEGQPDSTADVLQKLNTLKDDARELDKRFADEKFITGDTLSDCAQRISTLTDKLDKPDPVDTRPTWIQRLTAFGVAALALVVFVVGLDPLVWENVSRFGEFGSTSLSEILVWVGGVAAALLGYRVTNMLLLRSRSEAAKQSALRQQAETRLFEAYFEQDHVRAVRWLHDALRDDEGKPGFFRELRQQIESVEAAVKRLDDVYKGLHDEAAAEVSQAAKDPSHVRATIGDCLTVDQGVADRIVPDVTRRLQVESALDPNHRVRSLDLRLQPLEDDEGKVPAAAVAVATLSTTLTPDGKKLQLGMEETASRWKDAVWRLVNWKLGQDLPRTFEEALIKCEGSAESGTRFLTDKLNAITLPRRPSIDLRVPATEPIHRQMYIGNPGIAARLNAALNDSALDPEKADQLRHYAQGAQVVSSLGEQVVFLDLWADSGGQPWAPHVISNSLEANDAMKTYYGADPTAPGKATAKETCFTVVPELLAATKIEMGGIVKPLAPAVAARLLGSDLEMKGPTFAELFYLLRARDIIRFDREGSGPTLRTLVRLNLDDQTPMGLVDFPAGGVEDSNYFGRGRDYVIAFDAFCDFMRFDGTPLIGDGTQEAPWPNANLLQAAWANEPDRVARLQHAAAMQWYEGNFQTDGDEMTRVLESDLEWMRSGDSDVRDSWERAMRRLLNGEERRRIRSQLLNTPH